MSRTPKDVVQMLFGTKHINQKSIVFSPAGEGRSFVIIRFCKNLMVYARVAQSVEHQTFNLGVEGSIPSTGTKDFGSGLCFNELRTLAIDVGISIPLIWRKTIRC